MEPSDYLRALRPRWWVILVAALLGAGAAWITMPSSATEYEATHTLIIQSDTGEASSDGGEQTVAALAFLATTGAVPERAAEVLGEDDPEELADRVEVEFDEVLKTISMTAVDSDPDVATAIADAFATELIGYLNDEQEARRQEAIADLTEIRDNLQQEIETLNQQIAAGGAGEAPSVLVAERDANQRQYSSTFEQIEGLQDEGPGSSGLTTVDAASAEAVGSTSRLVRMVIGSGVGLLLGLGLALVLGRFDTRIRTREEAEDAFGLPVVAEVPRLTRRMRHGSHVVVADDPESLAAEAYRGLRTAVARAEAPTGTKSARRRSGGTRVVLVVSSGISEGKSSTVANLAAAYAETGRYVLVLSCDLRRPGLGRLLSVAPGAGLSEVLSGQPAAPRLADVIRTSAIDNVRVVTSGHSVGNPSELIGRVPDLISNARDYADVVLVDSAPFLATDDVSGMIPVVDAVVVCCRAGKTTLEAARRTTDRLNRLGAPVVGLALVEAPTIPTGRSYHYAYYLPRHRLEQRDADAGATGASAVSSNGGSAPRAPVDRVDYERDESDPGSEADPGAGEQHAGPRGPAA